MTESIEQMIDDLKGKLRLVNTSVLSKDSFPEEKKEELKEIHSMVMSRKNISTSEMAAITQALGDLRK
ncbi:MULTISPECIES: DUF1128 family protein [Mammaliicoccus]|uniref:DUF1128 domain-containing protein n=1 Tax=Mammaliicoccus vitulinus TaxID=71237 RepID=A0A2T4PU99_9STAP|nr:MULTISPECIES: DUF1128 family protein [Mammaliicoccus]HAL09415.1 DUF1128 domain-containing protein [Staphylococcus sp.]MBM6629875.1 DUF1128 family protein [Mammaliicoccus vitulinus]MBO3077959.1 DUF1128 family protein [Mammaliicoccus vitulinus]MEB7658265.1 DUF1128 domain-containing protein [Mammaliicoccus vitulinus]PNZ38415.1 DUF1128 domain-containing protein [Mammaliicoccus vitulinus]